MKRKIDEMAAFVRAVELRGFSAASRELGVTPSALSKLVSRLEARLGVRLLNRTTRHLGLTPEGELFVDRARKIVETIAEAESDVMQAGARPSGLLRLSCFTGFRHHLVPALSRFQERYPEMQVQMNCEDRLVDLGRDATDIAVRMGKLPDSSLIVRRLGHLKRVICASPAYLARAGTPRIPDDLAHHNCITMAGSASLARWPFLANGGNCVVPVSGSVCTNSGDALKDLAVHGVGIVRIVEMAVTDEIRTGRLICILADVHRSEPIPVHLVYARGRHRSRKVAVMSDFLADSFSLIQ